MKKIVSSLLLGLSLVAVSPVVAMTAEQTAVVNFDKNVEVLKANGIKTSFIMKHKVALIALGAVAVAAGTFFIVDGAKYTKGEAASEIGKSPVVVKVEARNRFAWTTAAAGNVAKAACATGSFVWGSGEEGSEKHGLRDVVITAPCAIGRFEKGLFTKYSKSPKTNTAIIGGQALALTAAILVGYDLCVPSEKQKFIIAWIKNMMGAKKAKKN